jgi:hypothetical protein
MAHVSPVAGDMAVASSKFIFSEEKSQQKMPLTRARKMVVSVMMR